MGPCKDAGPPVPAKDQGVTVNGTMLRQALAWIGDAGIFDQLKFHGHTKWLPVNLVVLAVMWVWSDSSTLTGAFAEAARFPFLRELLQLARELVVLVVEGQDDLGGARDVVAVEEPAVAVQVREDRLRDLERALLRLDQR